MKNFPIIDKNNRSNPQICNPSTFCIMIMILTMQGFSHPPSSDNQYYKTSKHTIVPVDNNINQNPNPKDHTLLQNNNPQYSVNCTISPQNNQTTINLGNC